MAWFGSCHVNPGSDPGRQSLFLLNSVLKDLRKGQEEKKKKNGDNNLFELKVPNWLKL